MWKRWLVLRYKLFYKRVATTKLRSTSTNVVIKKYGKGLCIGLIIGRYTVD